MAGKIVQIINNNNNNNNNNDDDDDGKIKQSKIYVWKPVQMWWLTFPSFFSFGGLPSIWLIIFSIKKLFTEEQDMLTHAKSCQNVSFRTS